MRWHVDGLSRGLVGRFNLLVGLFLTPVEGASDGALLVWPGSHRVVGARLDALLKGEAEEEEEEKENEVERGSGLSAVAAHRVALAFRDEVYGLDGRERFCLDEAPIAVTVAPGDVVLAHNYLAHAGAVNTSPESRTRLALYWRVHHGTTPRIAASSLCHEFATSTAGRRCTLLYSQLGWRLSRALALERPLSYLAIGADRVHLPCLAVSPLDDLALDRAARLKAALNEAEPSLRDAVDAVGSCTVVGVRSDRRPQAWLAAYALRLQPECRLVLPLDLATVTGSHASDDLVDCLCAWVVKEARGPWDRVDLLIGGHRGDLTLSDRSRDALVSAGISLWLEVGPEAEAAGVVDAMWSPPEACMAWWSDPEVVADLVEAVGAYLVPSRSHYAAEREAAVSAVVKSIGNDAIAAMAPPDLAACLVDALSAQQAGQALPDFDASHTSAAGREWVLTTPPRPPPPFQRWRLSGEDGNSGTGYYYLADSLPCHRLVAARLQTMVGSRRREPYQFTDFDAPAPPSISTLLLEVAGGGDGGDGGDGGGQVIMPSGSLGWVVYDALFPPTAAPLTAETTFLWSAWRIPAVSPADLIGPGTPLPRDGVPRRLLVSGAALRVILKGAANDCVDVGVGDGVGDDRVADRYHITSVVADS